MTQHIKHFDDLKFTVVATVEEYKIQYRLYEIVNRGENGGRYWQWRGAAYYPTPVGRLEDAELYMSGSIEEDGESNWYPYKEAQIPSFCVHSREDLIHLGDVMIRCWDWTSDLMPNFKGIKQTEDLVFPEYESPSGEEVVNSMTKALEAFNEPTSGR